MFGNLVIPPSLQNEVVEKDRLGGFSVLETGAYLAKVKQAYVVKSASSESRGIALNLEIDVPNDDGSTKVEERTFTTWITNKQGQPTYMDSKTNTPKMLAGFLQMNAFFHLFLEKDIKQYVFTKLVLPIYNGEQGKEVPTQVDAIPEIMGSYVGIAIQKIRTNKQEKDANGIYKNTNEERFINEIDKFFLVTPEGKSYTLQEAQANVPDPTFIQNWVEKNKGKVIDKFKETASATASVNTVKPKVSII